MSEQSDTIEYLLRLGDSSLVLSQRLAAWCGHAPVLEEDLAMANVALDLLGQAQLWFGEAANRLDDGSDANRLAFHRDEAEFRNLLLVEQPNGDFAMTTVRQLFFDVAHLLELEQLTTSEDSTIRAIATKSVKEVRYHVERSQQWVVRLGDGTDESHRRAQDAVDDLWMYSGEIFIPTAGEQRLSTRGVAPDFETLASAWRASVEATLEEATLRVPVEDWNQTGGKSGVHSEHLGYLLAEMQHLPRSHPDAQW
jgi:ring-1,2-phenylacetyl-CoA epoxidase subunit PaaC